MAGVSEADRPLPPLPEIPDAELEWRLPDWMVKRIAELKAAGMSPEEIATIVRKEAME